MKPTRLIYWIQLAKHVLPSVEIVEKGELWSVVNGKTTPVTSQTEYVNVIDFVFIQEVPL